MNKRTQTLSRFFLGSLHIDQALSDRTTKSDTKETMMRREVVALAIRSVKYGLFLRIQFLWFYRQ